MADPTILVHRRPERPLVFAVGAWNPLLPEHDELFAALRAHAREAGLSPGVVVLNPPPAYFVHPSNMVYHDYRLTVEQLMHRGVEGVVEVVFEPAHLALSLVQLVDVLQAHVPLAEIWVGAKQSLGNGSRGNWYALLALSATRPVQVRRLPESTASARSRAARLELLGGRFAAAAAEVGTAPTIRFDDGPTPDLRWPAGTYALQAAAGSALLETVLEAGRWHPRPAAGTYTVATGPAEWPDRPFDPPPLYFDATGRDRPSSRRETVSAG